MILRRNGLDLEETKAWVRRHTAGALPPPPASRVPIRHLIQLLDDREVSVEAARALLRVAPNRGVQEIAKRLKRLPAALSGADAARWSVVVDMAGSLLAVKRQGVLVDVADRPEGRLARTAIQILSGQAGLSRTDWVRRRFRDRGSAFWMRLVVTFFFLPFFLVFGKLAFPPLMLGAALGGYTFFRDFRSLTWARTKMIRQFRILGDPEAIGFIAVQLTAKRDHPELVQLFRDLAEQVNRPNQFALSRLEERAMMQVAMDPRSPVAEQAIKALAYIGDYDSHSHLQNYLRRPGIPDRSRNLLLAWLPFMKDRLGLLRAASNLLRAAPEPGAHQLLHTGGMGDWDRNELLRPAAGGETGRTSEGVAEAGDEPGKRGE